MVDDTNREDIGRTGGMGTSTSGTMNRGETAGQKVKQGWNEFKGKIKNKWNRLTDKDLDTYQNKGREEVVVFIYQEVGGDRSMVERDVDAFARDANYRW